MFEVISVDDSESESDSKKQDVHGIIQDQLREEMPLDGDEWETVTGATKLLEKPCVKARSPAQGAPALRLEQMDNPCPNFFHGRLAHVVREISKILSPKVLLDYEVEHWDYLARYRPQQAYMAHAMAGGGKYGDFCNPKSSSTPS
jgi:hypothetical protein